MRIELTLVKDGLPKNGLGRISEKFSLLMEKHYPNAHVRVKLGSTSDVSVQAGEKNSKAHIMKLLEEMFEDANDWLYIENDK